jgi:hypothetical protein
MENTWNQIWKELKTYKTYALCAREYASIQRKLSVIYNISIPLLAAVCVFLAKIENYDATIVTACIILISSGLKAIFPRLLLSDKSLDAIDAIGTFFDKHANEAQFLMNGLRNNTISVNDAEKKLEKLIKTKSNKETELNKLVLWIPFWVNRRMTKQVERELKENNYE